MQIKSIRDILKNLILCFIWLHIIGVKLWLWNVAYVFQGLCITVLILFSLLLCCNFPQVTILFIFDVDFKFGNKWYTLLNFGVRLHLLLLETFLNSLSEVVDKVFRFLIVTFSHFRNIRRRGLRLELMVDGSKMAFRNDWYLLFRRLFERWLAFFFSELSQTSRGWKSCLFRFLLNNFQRFFFFTFCFLFNFYLPRCGLLEGKLLSLLWKVGIQKSNFSVFWRQLLSIIIHCFVNHVFELNYLFPHGVLNLFTFLKFCLQEDALPKRPVKEGTGASHPLFDLGKSSFFEALEIWK